MKIDIISDLHADFYVRMHKGLKEKNVLKFIENMYEENHECGEVLMVAGDISHYNTLTKRVLELLLEVKGYKKIFFVLGNHDYYLISNNAKHRYRNNSKNRINEVKEMFSENPDIHYLDGEIVEYNGVKFGGCNGFYDGSYTMKVNPMANAWELWKRVMNDYVYIKGYPDGFYEISGIEKQKLENVYKEADVIMTHVNPMPHAMFFDEEHRMDPVTGFYAFDGEYQVEHTPAVLWLFGHTHTEKDIEVYGTRVMCNALGYPQEGKSRGKSSILVKTVEVNV